jgi:hypothetical protein
LSDKIYKLIVHFNERSSRFILSVKNILSSNNKCSIWIHRQRADNKTENEHNFVHHDEHIKPDADNIRGPPFSRSTKHKASQTIYQLRLKFLAGVAAEGWDEASGQNKFLDNPLRFI